MNCLDPTAAFRAYSPGGQVDTGKEVRLRLFANRKSDGIRYLWSVSQRPGGSEAGVINPEGLVSMSSPYEYHYRKNNVATFTADQPGEYSIKLTATLVFPDRIDPAGSRDSTYVMTITAVGEPIGGCSLGATSPRLALALLAGLLGLAAFALHAGRRRGGPR